MKGKLTKVQVVTNIGGLLWQGSEGKLEKGITFSSLLRKGHKYNIENWEGLQFVLESITKDGNFQSCGIVEDVFIRTHIQHKRFTAVYEKWLPLESKIIAPFVYEDWR